MLYFVIKDYAWLLSIIASTNYREKLRILFAVHAHQYLHASDRAVFWEKRPVPSDSLSTVIVNPSFSIESGIECGEEMTEELKTNEAVVVPPRIAPEADISEDNQSSKSSAELELGVQKPNRSSRCDPMAYNTLYTGNLPLEIPGLGRTPFIDLLKVSMTIFLTHLSAKVNLLLPCTISRTAKTCGVF